MLVMMIDTTECLGSTRTYVLNFIYFKFKFTTETQDAILGHWLLHLLQ